MSNAAPLLSVLALFGGAVTAADLPFRLPRDNMLVCRGPDGKPVPVKTVEDWTKRRAEVVRGMESVMG